jgi:hypothetical protein
LESPRIAYYQQGYERALHHHPESKFRCKGSKAWDVVKMWFEYGWSHTDDGPASKRQQSAHPDPALFKVFFCNFAAARFIKCTPLLLFYALLFCATCGSLGL